MRTFKNFMEARNTGHAAAYSAALVGLCRNDWSEALILADFLPDNDVIGGLIRAAHELSQVGNGLAFMNFWMQFLAEMTERYNQRTQPYRVNHQIDSPTFYYTRKMGGFMENEFYVHFNTATCSFRLESAEAGTTKRIDYSKVDEYILRCAVGYKLHQVVKT